MILEIVYEEDNNVRVRQNGGQYQPREQDFVISPEGCCMSIPASYSRHPFNVMEFIYEDNVQGSGGDSL